MTRSDQESDLKVLVEESSGDPSLDLAYICAQSAIDKKGENLSLLYVGEVCSFADYFLICSAMSDRQVSAISDHVVQRMKAENQPPLSVEGTTEGRWAVLDFGSVIVHVFLDAIRDYYDIESLWTDADKVSIPSEFYGPASARLN